MRGMQAPIFLLLVVVSCFGARACFSQDSGDESASPKPTSDKAEFDAQELALLQFYRKQVHPNLVDSERGCVDCHSDDATSSLVLTGAANSDFWTLFDGGYFAAAGPDTLLHRLTTEHGERRMPKDAEAWSEGDVSVMRELSEQLDLLETQSGTASDERFPRSLLAEYDGVVRHEPTTQFITFRQLKGKISTIFGDTWHRGGRDLFAENIAMFGGADFEKRFNESASPNASYLAGLEILARDVALRSLRLRRGPFAEFSEADLDSEISPHRRQALIKQLFERVLFRSPTVDELESADALVRSVAELDTIQDRDYEIAFQLTASDPETETESVKSYSISVVGDRQSVQQFFVDQRPADESIVRFHQHAFKPLVTQLVSSVVAHRGPHDQMTLGNVWLGGQAPVATKRERSRVVLHNVDTSSNVSFAGLELLDATGRVVSHVAADSPLVESEGAWEITEEDGLISLEDANRHKGLSTICVPLSAEVAGEYTVNLLWRPSDGNDSAVLVELYGGHGESRVAHRVPGDVEYDGLPQFFYDSTRDEVPYVEFPGVYLFGSDSYVEIANRDTQGTVTAGGLELVDASDPSHTIMIDSLEAEGSDQWQEFDAGRFKAYNVRGTKLHDDGKRKGDLKLRFRFDGESVAKLLRDSWYRVRLYYPGKRDNAVRVPVVIRAKQSSPIVHVAVPRIAKADAVIKLDASTSFTSQGSPVEFQWAQTAGPQVHLDDPRASSIQFALPRQAAAEYAWASLCGGLIRHPDFLFTQPPSFDNVGEADRIRLQLSKLTLDLLGRSPNTRELAWLSEGKSLKWIVAKYLDSPEFRDFYFHRVRLYLESQGGEVQDEPARIWSYIAFEDRDFRELLTADYTVDVNFQRHSRAPEYGRTGLLTARGFIEGKPGLPHYNYAAQVSMLFLGYVYQVPPEIVEQREGVTALGTTDPNSACYSCHKILTPLAFQRLNWDDNGSYRTVDESGVAIDASDRDAAVDYPFKGDGLEAFAEAAVKKERFIRTIINTHVSFYFGRQLRHRTNERGLYKQLWDCVHENDFRIRDLIREIVLSDQYLGEYEMPMGG